MKKLSTSGTNSKGLLNDLKLKESPFSVPKDYFHNLTKDITQKKNILESTQNALLVPPDYQAELTQDILLKIEEEKLRATVSHDGFTVPDQYFEELQAAILNKTSQKEKDATVIPFQKPRRTWLRYVSAASIVLALSIVAFFQLGEREATSEVVEAENIINEVPVDEIISYLAFYSETGDYIILSEELSEQTDDFKDSFSSEEIESYLENSI